jgi:hypothetical protein
VREHVLARALRSLILIAALCLLAASPGRAASHVRDEVQLFDPASLDAMELRLAALERDTGFAVYLEARAFQGFEEFTPATERTFQELIERLGHYRVALVLLGVDREAGRGMVGTNLGAGLHHILSREQAADLFLADGERFSVERIQEGLERLASRLEEWHSTTRGQEDVFAEDPDTGGGFPVAHLYPLLIIVVLGIFATWRAWRAKLCPMCGSSMRTRVRIGGPGGAAVRTRKCFDCGHVKKERFESWSRRGSRRNRGTPEV